MGVRSSVNVCCQWPKYLQNGHHRHHLVIINLVLYRPLTFSFSPLSYVSLSLILARQNCPLQNLLSNHFHTVTPCLHYAADQILVELHWCLKLVTTSARQLCVLMCLRTTACSTT